MSATNSTSRVQLAATDAPGQMGLGVPAANVTPIAGVWGTDVAATGKAGVTTAPLFEGSGGAQVGRINRVGVGDTAGSTHAVSVTAAINAAALHRFSPLHVVLEFMSLSQAQILSHHH